MTTLRWIVFGLLYRAMEDSVNRKAMRVLGALVALVGAVLLSIWLWKLPARIGAIHDPRTAMSVDVACDKMVTGGTYSIRVDGKTYQCGGADSWCPAASPATLVTYSASEPARCRATHNVGRLSRWEGGGLLACALFLMGGVSLLLIREDDPHAIRGALSHGLFLLNIVLAACMMYFEYGPMY